MSLINFGDIPIEVLKYIFNFIPIGIMETKIKYVNKMFNQIYETYEKPRRQKYIYEKNNKFIKMIVNLMIYCDENNIEVNIENKYTAISHPHICIICKKQKATTNDFITCMDMYRYPDNYISICNLCKNKIPKSHMGCYVNYKNIIICDDCIVDPLFDILIKYVLTDLCCNDENENVHIATNHIKIDIKRKIPISDMDLYMCKDTAKPEIEEFFNKLETRIQKMKKK